MDYIIFLVAFGAVCTLTALILIDLKHMILPDWLNGLLALLGICFHATLGFKTLEPPAMLYGALLGGGLLLLARYFGNKYYKQDTLGLGDVKLLAAGGVWLGPENIIYAITLGAFAVVCHSIAIALIRASRDNTKPNFHRLLIPAGPGYCVGIFALCVREYASVLGNLLGDLL
ncbi:MAG: A24 family peptidase [Pseudobdellovibrionaceae bacterium]